MRASEQSRRRRLLLGKAMRGIAEPLFLWHDQPREERALRGGSALNVRELKPQGRQSRGTTRAHKLLVHVPAALCGCWDPSYWWTYQRHCGNAGTRVTGGRTSGIVECWDPRYWWTYQRRCVNAGPKGFEARAGTPRWATNPRTGGPSDGLCVR